MGHFNSSATMFRAPHTFSASVPVLTASVASGVTSRGAGPVPPVVTTRQQPRSSTCAGALTGGSGSNVRL